MDWFLYDRDLHHERVTGNNIWFDVETYDTYRYLRHSFNKMSVVEVNWRVKVTESFSQNENSKIFWYLKNS